MTDEELAPVSRWIFDPNTQRQVEEIENDPLTRPFRIPRQDQMEAARAKIAKRVSATLSKLGPVGQDPQTERQRLLIEESNTIPLGQRDKLSELHRLMNAGPASDPRVPHPIDRILEEEKKAIREAQRMGYLPRPPSRPGWGRYGKQTRMEFAEDPRTQGAIENWINGQFEIAEEEDRSEFPH